MKKKWTENSILKKIKKIYKKDKSLLKVNNKNKKYISSLYNASRKIFGSYRMAIIKSGIKEDDIFDRKRWTKLKIKKQINKIYKVDINKLSFSNIKNNEMGLFMASSRIFGSWKKAVEFCNINYKTISITKKYISTFGKTFDSRMECFISNIFHYLLLDKKIKNFKYHVKVCSSKNWTCDFVIFDKNDKKIWIEYDGMLSLRKNPYQEANNEKINYYTQQKYQYYIIEEKAYSFTNVLNQINDILKLNISKCTLDKSKNEIQFLNKDLYLKDVVVVQNKIGKYPTCKEYDIYGKYCSSSVTRNLNMKWSEIKNMIKREL